MKILLYTDNHFSQYSSIVRMRGAKYSVRLENQIKSLNWINQLAIEEHCDRMICLGDFFDKPELNAEELSALKEVKWNGLPKEFIVGNHEMASSDLSFNSSNALASIGDIISEPLEWRSDSFRILYLPYILESDRKALSTYLGKDTVKTIILSHNDISGIRYGQYESKTGFNIDEINDNCDLFINGHLHNQTQINEKILNLGNLTGQNFSEDGFKYSHCAAILETTDLSVTLFDNPYALSFCKLDSDDYEQWKNKLIDNNFILTIKTDLTKADEIKTFLNNNNNILTYRLLIKPNIANNSTADLQDIISVDHIQQFKDYCISNIDKSEILLEELARL